MRTEIKRGYVKTYDDKGKLISKVSVVKNATQPELFKPEFKQEELLLDEVLDEEQF